MAFPEDEQQQENPYRALIRQDQAEREGALKQSVGEKVAPDARAQAITLGDKYGLPHDVVERNLDAFKQRAREDAPLEQQLLQRNPKLAEWLTQSPAAAAAADDLPQLQQLDNRLTFGATLLRGWDNEQANFGGFMEWLGELTGSESTRQWGKSIREYNQAQAAALGYASTTADALKGPWELAQYVKEIVGEQIPVYGPVLAGAAAGGEIGSIGGPLGATVGAIIGAAIPAFTGGIGETEGQVKQLDPNAQAPGLVLIAGSAVGALDTAVPAGIGARLVKTFGRETAEAIVKKALEAPVRASVLRGVVGSGVHAMASEGLTEALQQAIQDVTANAATGNPNDWRAIAADAAEAGAAGAVLGGLTGGAEGFAEQRHINRVVEQAEQQQQFFTALGQNVVDSKLAQRLPAAARQFIAHATKDGPLETVYAPLDTWEAYWQSQNVPPSVMAAELTGRADALEQAKRTGTDLAIPLSVYAEKLAGTEHNAFFAQELRLGEKLLNQREAKALQQTFLEVQEGAQQQRAPLDEATASSAAKVGSRIVEQALAIGERQDVAEQWGKLYESVYGEIGRRFKRDPLQLFEARPLSIVRDNGAVFTPAAKGERIGVDIPASEATPGETPDQRATRREAHMAALTASYVRDAQRLDPTVDPAMIRAEIEERLAIAEEQRSAELESGEGQELLRAIAAAGGIRSDAENTGEFTHYAVEGQDKRRKGARTTWNGVAGVFDVEGNQRRSKTWDSMLEALREDPRFSHLGDINDLIDAIDSAMRAKATSADVFPGTEELQDLGVVPGTKWWSDRWRAPEADVDETATEGDVSFNPDEFEQRRPRRPRRDQQLFDAIKREQVGYAQLEATLTPGGTEASRKRQLVLEQHPPRFINDADPRVRELEQLASEQALGIEDVPLEEQDQLGQSTVFRDRNGDIDPRNPINCTDCAEVFLERAGVAGVIVGYAEEANDGLVAEGLGHDFAIVEDRFLVDPWGHQIDGTERAVFDLADEQDRAYVRAMYADPAVWTVRSKVGEYDFDWIPYTNRYVQVERRDEEFFQHERDPQRTHMGPEDVAIARLQLLPPLAGAAESGMYDPSSREVPFPRVSESEAMDLFDAASGLEAEPRLQNVPIADIIATQKAIVPATVVQYIVAIGDGEEQPPPLLMHLHGKYYLADGTHRTTAMWARGQLTVPAAVIEVDEQKLQQVRGGPRPVDAAGRELLGEGGYIGARVEGNQAVPTDTELKPPTARNDGGPNPYSEREARRQAAKGSIDTTGELYQLDERNTPEGFEVVDQYLQPDELSKLRADTAQRLIDIFQSLPLDVDYEEAALAGRAKKGWYERSTKAILQVFGPVDAVRFAALLAAMSPQTQVETNLLNTVRLWSNWDAAGRPTAPKAIDKLLKRSVAGGTEQSVLKAWRDNAIRVLRDPDGQTIKLSGAKVSSFMRNLWGHLNEVTNDAWMAAFALVDKSVLSSRMQLDVDTGTKLRGKSPGYRALSAKIRRVAATLTRKTGELWTPAHVQETVWSWTKTLYELAEAEGSSAVRVLREGGLTDAAIAQTPDFAQLMTRDATVREILEAAGYGEVLSALDQVVADDARQRDAATARARATQGAAGRVTPALLRSARRLDELKRRRVEAEQQRSESERRAAARKLRQSRVAAAARRRERGELHQEHPPITPPPLPPEEKPTTKGRRRAQPYKSDLFGKRLPARYGTSTALVPTGKRELGTNRIVTAEDAATAAAYLARGAVERFDAIVTDEEGTPLAIVGSFKGSVIAAHVHNDVLLGEALRVKGAAQIWFAHNHPSGTAALSDDDKKVAATAARMFEHTGVRVRGILSVTDRGYWEAYDPHAHLERGLFDAVTGGYARPSEERITVPIVERQFDKTEKLGPAVTSIAGALEHIPPLAGGKFGMALLDAQNRPIAYVPMNPDAAAELKAGGRLGDLYRSLSIATPAAAIIYAPVTDDVHESSSAAANLANALDAGALSVLDIILDRNVGRPVSVTEMLAGRNQKFELSGEFEQEDTPKGNIQGAFNPSENVIRLISGKADLSTFLHESGHFFLELLADIATTVDVATAAPEEQQLLRDIDTVLKYGGFQGTLAEWRALPLEQRRQVHEAFARAFEQYLADGKAPSSELRQLFIKFRDWLVAAYRNARGLNIELPEDIRGVFDRLLASDEAIADAQHEAQMLPLFTDPAIAGVDALTFDAYRQRIQEANQAAREDLDRRLLQDWRRERQIWWKAEREVVEAAVRTEVTADPTYIALSVMRTGKLPDGAIPPMGDGRPIKLSKTIIKREYGKERLEQLQRKRPVVYSVEGGIHPDTAAELFGFATGEALLDAIAAAAPMERVIQGETDRRMRERHGDLLLEGMELRAIAEQVVHDHRAEVISEELRVLTQGMAGAVIPPADVIKAQAEAEIRRTPVRRLKPGQYLMASRRAAKQAFDAFARNDRRAAVAAKQQELIALAHYRAARDAKQRADVIRDRLQEFSTKNTLRARVAKAGQDYLDQIDGFLERYEFARVSQKQIDRRQSLRKWKEAQEAEGLPVQLPDEVLDDARRVNWQELPLEELEGINAAVLSIAHLARLKNRLLTAKDARELEAVRLEIATAIRGNVKERRATHEPRSVDERRRAFVEGWVASHRKIASLAREFDGFQDGGPMWEHVIRPLNEAGNREATMNADAIARLATIFNTHYTPLERSQFGKKQWIEALGKRDNPLAALSREGRLMVALYWGNETQRQRLRDGKGWSDAQVQAILDTLDKRDWHFVQAVWDFINSYWPDIEAKQRRVVGVAPKKEEATPVYTRFGEFTGGYFPLMYEGELAGDVYNLETAAAADMQKAAAYVHATPARPHTNERAEGKVTKPLRLDFGTITLHTARVIHDLTHHETLIDVGRIVGGQGNPVTQAIYDTLGPRAYDQFRRALKDIAVGDLPAQHEGERMLSYIRSGVTIAGLGWSFTTMALQPLGLTQSIARIGAKHVAKGLAHWLRGAATMEHTVEGIYAKSEFMRNRGRTQLREINELRGQVGLDTGKFSAIADAALRGITADKLTKQALFDSFFTGIQKLQLVADVPTWLGAYEKASSEGHDDATAIALADQAVLDSQGGGQIKDLAAIQRGGPAWRIWTNFYSFFNTTFNLWTESYRRTDKRNPIELGRLAVDYMLLFAVPAVLGKLLRDALTGDLPDELEKPEEYAYTLARELGAYMLGTQVLLREAAGALQGYSDYSGPAGARGFTSIAQLATQVAQMEADEAFFRALNQAGGALFHYPAAQVDRTVRGIIALANGDTSNPLAPFVGPPRKK